MTSLFKWLFGVRNESKRDFSDFFTKNSTIDKVDLLKRVVREANEDQKKLMEEAEKILSKRAIRT